MDEKLTRKEIAQKINWLLFRVGGASINDFELSKILQPGAADISESQRQLLEKALTHIWYQNYHMRAAQRKLKEFNLYSKERRKFQVPEDLKSKGLGDSSIPPSPRQNPSDPL